MSQSCFTRLHLEHWYVVLTLRLLLLPLSCICCTGAVTKIVLSMDGQLQSSAAVFLHVTCCLGLPLFGLEHHICQRHRLPEHQQNPRTPLLSRLHFVLGPSHSNLCAGCPGTFQYAINALLPSACRASMAIQETSAPSLWELLLLLTHLPEHIAQLPNHAGRRAGKVQVRCDRTHHSHLQWQNCWYCCLSRCVYTY